MAPTSSYTAERRVDFAETDMAGVVHFSNFFRYVESAEHEFFRSLGLALHADEPGHMHGWVRVHAACDYLRPARYEDRIAIELVVAAKGRSSLTYRFAIRMREPRRPEMGVAAGTELARGELKVVYVVRDASGGLSAEPMPQDVDHVWNGAEGCLDCHGPDGGLPKSQNHPVGRDCQRCHVPQN